MLCQRWKELFEPRILQRGRAYHSQGAVDMVRREGDIIHAIVLGSERYRVAIHLERDEIAGWSCDCPYASDGTPCKHLAAVFYALEDTRGQGTQKEPRQKPLEELVAELDSSQAKILLLRLAQRDEAAAELIRLAAGAPAAPQLRRWETRIDQLLERAAGRDGYISYARAWEAMCALADCLSDAAGQLLSAGFVWEAFSLTGYGFLAAVQYDMDDSDGGLTMLFETCHDLWREQVNAASPEQKRDMYRWFQETGQSGPDLCREFCPEIQWDFFQEPEFLREDIRQLDRMLQAAKARGDSRYELSRLAVKKLALMEQLGLPQEEIRQAEEEHWSLPGVRARAIRRLLEDRQYERAEALLLESKELDREWPGLVCGYSEELIALYEDTRQGEKLLEELQFQVFHFSQHDLAYVRKLREHIPADQWPTLRERLLAGHTLYGDLREELLALDGLYDRLLAQVTAWESLSALDRWEAVLRPRFPDRMRDAYIQCMETQMRLSGNRKQYASVIAYLKKLRAYPGRLDAELAERWQAVYPRRRSMLDELQKAGY